MKRVGLLLGSWIVLYACSGTEPGTTGEVDASSPVPTSTTPIDGATPTPPRDASTPSADGSVQDATTDGAPSDAGRDAADSSIPPAPAVLYLGRWDIQGGEAQAGYPSSRAIVRFRGTGVAVTARDAYNQTWLDVSVDGAAPTAMLVSGTAPQVLTLAEGLPMGDHVVEIYKRTEAFSGAIRLSSFTFPGGGQLLAPPRRKTRRIEIVGNSTLTGYGVDGARGGANCGTSAVHNARRSLIPLLAEGLDAEDFAPSVSGTGVLTNETPSDTVLIDVTYPRTLPRSASPLWDFTTWQPDAIVVMIGGTDVANPRVDPPPSQAAFSAAYTRFLALLRTKNPNAHVFAVTSPTTTNFFPVNDVNGTPYNARTKLIGGIADAVAARNAAGDTKVYPFTFGVASDAETMACAFHPTFALYQRMAAELVPFVKLKVGW